MKVCLALFLLLPMICRAEPYSIEPADIVLDIPEGWFPLDRETFPEAPGNMCFPRFDHKVKQGRIDAVMWRNEDSLDEALDQYIVRLASWETDSLKYQEVSRGPFRAESGIEGIKYVFQATRQSPCGPYTWKVVRYVFRNSQGEIVCLGGFGDVEEVDQIVISSLRTK